MAKTRPLPKEMLCPLAIYALSQRKYRISVILYSTTASETEEAELEIKNPITSQGLANIIIRPADLSRMDSLITAQTGSVTTHARKEFAQGLEFRLARR
ncbi:MAG: hypothetical protein OES09_07800 [Gammaproteobacteria bacterium]|nr:hypothetical protein [Gammaproteobacteria bacterium]